MEMQSRTSSPLKKVSSKYWQNERTFPRYFQDGEEVWKTNGEEEFNEFCAQMYGIYEVGNVLIYVEPNGNIHFSKLRGKEIDLDGLLKLKQELLERFECLYAWINKRDWGLKRLAERCGFTFSLTEMRRGSSHGKVMVWQLYKLID